MYASKFSTGAGLLELPPPDYSRAGPGLEGCQGTLSDCGVEQPESLPYLLHFSSRRALAYSWAELEKISVEYSVENFGETTRHSQGEPRVKPTKGGGNY